MTSSQINPNQLRPPGDDGGFGPIIRVGYDRRAEAAERLVGSNSAAGTPATRDHARQFLDYANEHGVNLEAMWSRLDRAGRIQMTVLAVPSPGRTAMMFAGHPASRAQVRSLGGLIDHACRGLGDLDVNLAQVLMDPGDALDREAFRIGSFTDLAILSYLERPLRGMRPGSNPPPVWPAGVRTLKFEESQTGLLLDVLEQSYVDTLDCPGLRGHRKTSDILAGHRASGVFDPHLWTLLLMDDQPAGALLLNASADQQTIELVYLGLLKSARGMGLGTQLLRHGMQLLEGRNERAVHLAVDESNAPALALYRRENFRPVLRRAAMIRPITPRTEAV